VQTGIAAKYIHMWIRDATYMSPDWNGQRTLDSWEPRMATQLVKGPETLHRDADTCTWADIERAAILCGRANSDSIQRTPTLLPAKKATTLIDSTMQLQRCNQSHTVFNTRHINSRITCQALDETRARLVLWSSISLDYHLTLNHPSLLHARLGMVPLYSVTYIQPKRRWLSVSRNTSDRSNRLKANRRIDDRSVVDTRLQ